MIFTKLNIFINYSEQNVCNKKTLWQNCLWKAKVGKHKWFQYNIKQGLGKFKHLKKQLIDLLMIWNNIY